MELKGRLKIELEEWLLNVDLEKNDFVDQLYYVLYYLPLPMQFTALCGFLMEKEKIDSFGIGKNTLSGEETVMLWQYPKVLPFLGETKDAAIEKAIEYLNENY